jgi:hypothetical protein
MQLLLKADGNLAVGGSSVLMMHSERLADRLDEFTRAIAAISKKRNKTEVDEEEIGRLEFYGGLYTEPQIPSPADLNGQVISLPAWNVLRCLQEGATRQKRGKDVLRGVYPLTDHVELRYEGPTNIVERWQGGYWIRKTVGVQRSRTVRTRAIFTGWGFELPIEVDPTVFDVHTLRVAWHDAGIYVGLCEMRPIQGRFEGTVEELEPAKKAASK